MDLRCREREQKRLGANLTKARKEIGDTQKQVAENMGVDPSTYCGWETGRRAIPIDLVLPLCSILEMSVTQLFLGDSDNV